METARSWFNKLKSKDKIRPSKKKEAAGNAKEGSKPLTSEEVPSNVTKQRVEAAKQYIENHYKKQMKSMQERRERYDLNSSSGKLTCSSLTVKRSYKYKFARKNCSLYYGLTIWQNYLSSRCLNSIGFGSTFIAFFITCIIIITINK